MVTVIRRRASQAVFAVAVGLGLLIVVAGAVTRPALLPAWVAVGGFVGLGVYVAILERAHGEPARAGRHTGMLAGALAVAVCLAVTGMVTVLGAASGPVILFLLLASAPCVWRDRARLLRWISGTGQEPDRRRSAPDRHANTPELVPVSPVLDTLSTPELCLAWRRSYLMLLDAPAHTTRHDIVTLRQCLLDELERRDRAGFRRWLDNGARAGSDPGRYLSADQ